MLPFTTSAFSSAVPSARLLTLNFLMSERRRISENCPLASNSTCPRGFGPRYSFPFWVAETSFHAPMSQFWESAAKAGVAAKTSPVAKRIDFMFHLHHPGKHDALDPVLSRWCEMFWSARSESL